MTQIVRAGVDTSKLRNAHMTIHDPVIPFRIPPTRGPLIT